MFFGYLEKKPYFCRAFLQHRVEEPTSCDGELSK